MDELRLTSRHIPSPADHPPEGQKRFRLTIEYDGTAYSGWQRQINGPSVQQTLEEALARLTGETIGVVGSSRTDAGVHALGQRVHFDTASPIPPDKFPFALNTCLPADIRVLDGRYVPAAFHARFDAAGKRYTYRIHNAPHASALYRHLCAHVPVPLQMGPMERSLKDLLGTHDFSAFQAAGGTAKTTVRTIEKVELTRQGDDLTLTIQGNAFLYNMVRIIAGTMIGVGMGRLPEDSFEQALRTGDRLKLGMTAPACGLELTEVFYRDKDLNGEN